MIGHGVAAFGCPHPLRGFAEDDNLVAAEARLITDHGASTALAGEAVTQRDPRRITLNRNMKLSATAGGASGIHGFGSSGQSRCEEFRLDFTICSDDRRIIFAGDGIIRNTMGR
jgi:hypothetical protein